MSRSHLLELKNGIEHKHGNVSFARHGVNYVRSWDCIFRPNMAQEKIQTDIDLGSTYNS